MPLDEKKNRVRRKQTVPYSPAKTRSKPGRVFTAGYSEALGTEICKQIIEGKSIKAICEMSGFPTRPTLARWLALKPEFQEMFLRAQQAAAYFGATEIIDLADNSSADSIAALQKTKLQIDTRKWNASKLIPKIYGDRQIIEEDNKQSDGVSAQVAEIMTQVLTNLKGSTPADVIEVPKNEI